MEEWICLSARKHSHKVQEGKDQNAQLLLDCCMYKNTLQILNRIMWSNKLYLLQTLARRPGTSWERGGLAFCFCLYGWLWFVQMNQPANRPLQPPPQEWEAERVNTWNPTVLQTHGGQQHETSKPVSSAALLLCSAECCSSGSTGPAWGNAVQTNVLLPNHRRTKYIQFIHLLFYC